MLDGDTGNNSVLKFQGGAGIGDVIDVRGRDFANLSALQSASSNLNGSDDFNLDAGNATDMAGGARFIANVTVA